MTIAGMLIVNNPGSWGAIHAPLRHAPWHGWTPTDLIFPFFIFIVGVATVFSFNAQRARGAERPTLLKRAWKRAAIIIALGLVLHGFPDYFDVSTLRIPGVLQRIGLAYAIAAPIVLWLNRRARIAVVAVLLTGYWAVQTLAPVPGGGTSTLQPGADLGSWIDRAVFGTAHLWSQSRTWDPEGLLSTLPAVGTLLLGVFIGEWLSGDGTPRRKATVLAGAGAIGLLAGAAWGVVFPINKNLWTSSYVVFTAGMACLVLALCYWTVDVRGWRRWAMPFVVFGTNAITAFFLSSLGARVLGMVQIGTPSVSVKSWIHSTLFEPWLAPRNASLAFALAYTTVWLGFMAVLYRRRIFIKV